MIKKRYSIVRVDNMCPRSTEENNSYCPQKEIDNFWCPDCRFFKKHYGDTKEQMILKVAQILFKNAPKETYQPRYIEQKRKILEVAKKIVEFLGVE